MIDLARRRARIARVNAKRPPEVTVTIRATPSSDRALLRRFGRWVDRLLIEAGTPEQGGKP